MKKDDSNLKIIGKSEIDWAKKNVKKPFEITVLNRGKKSCDKKWTVPDWVYDRIVKGR